MFPQACLAAESEKLQGASGESGGSAGATLGRFEAVMEMTRNLSVARMAEASPFGGAEVRLSAIGFDLVLVKAGAGS